MIENLFGYNEKNKGSNRKSSSQDPSSNIIQIIDGKKAQNLSIHLKAINITTNEVCDALKEGNPFLTSLKYDKFCVLLIVLLVIFVNKYNSKVYFLHGTCSLNFLLM